MERLTGVINSSKASEKSVVIDGCVMAEPKAAGCGLRASFPEASVRRLSFSIPRLSSVNREVLFARSKKARRCASGVAKILSSWEQQKAAQCNVVFKDEQCSG